METKRLYKSNSNKVFAGVCGGIGEYFNMDPVIVRLIWVAGTFFSAGMGILGYIIAAALIPRIDDSGEEKRNIGCLVAILVALLALAAIPIVLAILGLVGYVVFSGVGAVAHIAGILIWPSIFIAPILLVIIVILLLRRKK